jgi:hypothetical protein
VLACFTPPSSIGGTSSSSSPGAAPAAGSGELAFVGRWQAPAAEQAEQQAPAPVSKQSVRQRLALVSSCYPLARPTRGMLKQVYNFFEERRRRA